MDNLKRQLNTSTLQEYGLQLDAEVRRGEASKGGMFSVYFVICVIIFCLLVERGACLYCFSCSVMDSSKVDVVFLDLINLGVDCHKQSENFDILFCSYEL